MVEKSNTTLPDVLAGQAQRRPARIAVTDGTDALTYGELHRAVTEAADQCRRRGLIPGARVGMTCGNNLGDVVRLAGLVAAGADVLLFDPQARADERAGAARLVRGLRWFDPAHDVASGRRTPRLDARPSFFLCTSGSRGRPKVVARDWGSANANAQAFAMAAAYGDTDTIVCTTPLHHCYAFGVGLLASLTAGATLLLPALPVHPGTLESVVAAWRPTVLQSVPFLYRWYLASGARMDGLRLAVTAGEPAPVELIEGWRERTGVALVDHYGTTETGAITLNRAGVPGSVGAPVEGVTVRVGGGHHGGHPRAPGPGTGQLQVKVGGRSSRYAGDPSLSRESFCRGWFHTDDIGHLDADGNVFLEGRQGVRVNVAGRKVDPVEVENVLLSYPGVRECAVVGIPSPTTGQELVALVVAEHRLSWPDVRAYLAARLSSYKIPRTLEYRDELPRTRSGKLRRGGPA